MGLKMHLKKYFIMFPDHALVTLDQKNIIRVKFFEIEIYTSSESWINKISINVWFVMIG